MKIVSFLLCSCTLLLSCDSSESAFDGSGSFEAIEVIVSAEVPGTIKALDAPEGSQVRAGQVLGWIDTTQLYLKKKQLLAQIDAILSRRPQIATQLAAYRVRLETAERELLRLENLYQAEAATEKQLDDARSEVAVIRRQMEAHRSSLDISTQGIVAETLPLSAQIEQIDDQLRRSLIVNPLTGTILSRYAEVHELASPGTPLYKVADVTTLELRAYVSGAQLSQIKLGQKTRVFVDDGSGGYYKYPGVVSWISSKAEFTPKSVHTREERADLVYAVKIPVENDGHLKIGMYGEMKLEW